MGKRGANGRSFRFGTAGGKRETVVWVVIVLSAEILRRVSRGIRLEVNAEERASACFAQDGGFVVGGEVGC